MPTFDRSSKYLTVTHGRTSDTYISHHISGETIRILLMHHFLSRNLVASNVMPSQQWPVARRVACQLHGEDLS
jgi:hypothetical protein